MMRTHLRFLPCIALLLVLAFGALPAALADDATNDPPECPKGVPDEIQTRAPQSPPPPPTSGGGTLAPSRGDMSEAGAGDVKTPASRVIVRGKGYAWSSILMTLQMEFEALVLHK